MMEKTSFFSRTSELYDRFNTSYEIFSSKSAEEIIADSSQKTPFEAKSVLATMQLTQENDEYLDKLISVINASKDDEFNTQEQIKELVRCFLDERLSAYSEEKKREILEQMLEKLAPEKTALENTEALKELVVEKLWYWTDVIMKDDDILKSRDDELSSIKNELSYNCELPFCGDSPSKLAAALAVSSYEACNELQDHPEISADLSRTAVVAVAASDDEPNSLKWLATALRITEVVLEVAAIATLAYLCINIVPAVISSVGVPQAGIELLGLYKGKLPVHLINAVNAGCLLFKKELIACGLLTVGVAATESVLDELEIRSYQHLPQKTENNQPQSVYTPTEDKENNNTPVQA